MIGLVEGHRYYHKVRDVWGILRLEVQALSGTNPKWWFHPEDGKSPVWADEWWWKDVLAGGCIITEPMDQNLVDAM